MGSLHRIMQSRRLVVPSVLAVTLVGGIAASCYEGGGDPQPPIEMPIESDAHTADSDAVASDTPTTDSFPDASIDAPPDTPVG
jgi:hypothetical protein